jgi:hypothetical protein
MISVFEDPVGSILDSIPTFRPLDISARSNVYALLHRRIQKLSFKIKMAAYAAVGRPDRFGLNDNFPGALCKWLGQFPEGYKLGFLLSALSTEYVTRQEMQLFLNTAIRRLEEKMVENEAHLGLPLGPSGSRNIRVYPVSQFGAYDDFVHRIGLGGTRDRDKQPIRSTVEEAVDEAFFHLRNLAENEPNFIYYEEHSGAVKQLLRSFLNAHVVLVEDSSFSGTRISNSLSKFLRLTNVLFGKYTKRLTDMGYSPPWIYLVVLFGTRQAMDVALKATENEQLKPASGRFFPIFGFVFEETDTSKTALPENLGELQSLLAGKELHNELARAVDFFKEKYFYQYLRETQISVATGTTLEEIKWGFGGKGWSVVTDRNCPNNSLPLLWYPHAGSSCKEIKALFPRIESHTSHANKAGSFEDNLGVAEKDGRGYLRTFISRFYDSLK